ncbi:triacylglycerol lipase OBL1-like [Cucumis melo]|uniref:Triacylglycerol lipase OBL1-like n=1 Tax=Cucumis melo TaxID=3656 RepID=A0ABM3L0V3_CUCME|nr:triacylglycerol lipase OBL1-like [Cucumis melo]
MVWKEHEFSKNYVILKPHNANVFDLILFILPFGFKKRKLMDCPDGKEDSYRSFADRLIIFVSLLLQILILTIAIPLANLDAFLQKLFNFISFNGTIPQLFFKFVRGETLVQPNKSSPDYTSVVGFTDWRRDLDNSISPDDTFRYYSVLTVMASKLSYESLPFVQSVVNDRWKMKLLGYYNFWNDFQSRATTQAFMFQTTASDPNITVVAFRGTTPLDAYDWQVNVDFSWYDIHGVGRIHSGFMKALGLQKRKGWPKELTPTTTSAPQFAYYTLRQKLIDIAKTNANARFILTGHSLGAALAVLFVAILALHDESLVLEKIKAIYSYGQPRVGDRHFAEFMIVKGQPNKNYFSLLWLIPKYLNAWLELVRSFLIPFVKGYDYYESLAMKGVRFIGLLMPGLTAHIPTDYVNSTRLGKLNVPEEILEDGDDCIEPDY